MHVAVQAGSLHDFVKPFVHVCSHWPVPDPPQLVPDVLHVKLASPVIRMPDAMLLPEPWKSPLHAPAETGQATIVLAKQSLPDPLH